MHGGAAKLKVEREWSRYQNDRRASKISPKIIHLRKAPEMNSAASKTSQPRYMPVFNVKPSLQSFYLPHGCTVS